MFGRRKTRVAINGFGRIGRSFFRAAWSDNDLEIVAINDLADPENLAYLLQHDSVYGPLGRDVALKDGALLVGRKKIQLLSEKDPARIPWSSLDIDIVVEATGVFESYAKASAHLTAGAKHVVISAPASDEPAAGVRGATVLMGLNEDRLATCNISSNASCTTNAGSPLIAILDGKLGIEKALLNTVHAYTATQALVDSPAGKKDMRRGRAAAHNIIPASTGAAVATTKVVTSLTGKFDGIAVRVPVIAGSLVDVTFVAGRHTTAEEVNLMLEDAADDPKWKGIFAVTREPLVSSDIVGNTHAAIADLSFTRVVGGTLVKVLAWYDNEAGYAHTLVLHVKEAGVHARA